MQKKNVLFVDVANVEGMVALIPMVVRNGKDILVTKKYYVISPDKCFNTIFRKSAGKLSFIVKKKKIYFEEIIENSKNQETSSKLKTIIHAEEGLFSIKQIEKDLEDNNRSEGESNGPKQYTIEDAAFIETRSKPGERKKWREIFDKGKANGPVQVIQVI